MENIIKTYCLSAKGFIDILALKKTEESGLGEADVMCRVFVERQQVINSLSTLGQIPQAE